MAKGHQRNYHVEGEKIKMKASPPRSKLYSSDDETTMIAGQSKGEVQPTIQAPGPPLPYSEALVEDTPLHYIGSFDGEDPDDDSDLGRMFSTSSEQDTPPPIPASTPSPSFSLPELATIDIKFRLVQGIIATQASELAEVRRKSNDENAALQSRIKKLTINNSSLKQQRRYLVGQRDVLKGEKEGLEKANERSKMATQMSIGLILEDNKRLEARADELEGLKERNMELEERKDELESQVQGLPERVKDLEGRIEGLQSMNEELWRDRAYLKKNVLAGFGRESKVAEKFKASLLIAAQEWEEIGEQCKSDEAAVKERLDKMK